jgi:hypothetical protein
MTPLRCLSFAAALFASSVADIRQVSESRTGGSFEASLTRFGDGFAAAWYDTRDGVPSIYVRRLTADGVPAGPEIRLTRDRTAYEPDIAALGSNLIVGWYEYDEKAGFRAMVGSWSANGKQRWVKTVSAPGYLGRNTMIRTDGQRIAVAWIQEFKGQSQIQVRWLDANGNNARGRLMTFYTPVSATTWNLNGDINPIGDPADLHGNFWVTWDAEWAKKGTSEILLGRPTPLPMSGSVTRLTPDDGIASKYPDLAFAADGTLAVTWFDRRDGNEEIYLAVSSQPELERSVAARARRVTDTSGESIGAYLAWNGDRLGLAWCDKTAGQHEIYFQGFDKTGAPLGDARQITHTPADSLIPAVRPFGDGFALLWNEFIAGPGGGHDPRSRSDVMFTRVSATP